MSDWRSIVRPSVQSQTFAHVPGYRGAYLMNHPGDAGRPITYDEFERRSLLRDFNHTRIVARNRTSSLMNAALFNNFTQRSQLYGFDFKRTLFPTDFAHWNLRHFGNELDATLDHLIVEGVNRSMTILGTAFSTFVYHHEDLDLAAINYIHVGSGKSWFIVHPDDNQAFEDLTRLVYAEPCLDGSEHKVWFLDPSFLIQNNIRVVQVIQF